MFVFFGAEKVEVRLYGSAQNYEGEKKGRLTSCFHIGVYNQRYELGLN